MKLGRTKIVCMNYFFFYIKEIINKGSRTVVTLRGNYGDGSKKDIGRM